MAKKFNAAQEAASLFQRIKQGAGNIAGGVINRVAQTPLVNNAPLKQPMAISNFVQDLPFHRANIIMALQKRGRSPLTFTQYDKLSTQNANMNSNPVYQSMNQVSPVSQESANYGRNFEGAITATSYPIAKASNPRLEQLKQQVLSNPNMRPAARQYLSNVPITYGTKEGFESRGKGVAAFAAKKGLTDQEIVVNPRYAKSTKTIKFKDGSVYDQAFVDTKLKEVIEHELLHQAPRLIRQGHYNPENDSQVKSYTERWGKKYMSARKGALVEEMFAEQDLPPVYYWHIYKNVTKNASPKGFIDSIVSYFTKSQGRQGVEN